MTKEKKNNNILQDRFLLFLIIILVILSIAIVVLKISTINNLDTNDKLVTELHNYFNSDDLGKCEGLFTYAETKITYDKIESETRLCIAYQKAEIDDIETGTIKANKKKETCTLDAMTFRINEGSNECSYTKVKKEIIDNSYKKLYGKEIENNEKFRIDNTKICYLKDEYYYCGLSEIFTYTFGNESLIYRVIDKATEKNNTITIYDYFIKLNSDSCFYNYTTNNINSKCTKALKEDNISYKFMKKYGTKYKHIFNKANDGTYYWVSSEPISK